MWTSGNSDDDFPGRSAGGRGAEGRAREEVAQAATPAAVGVNEEPGRSRSHQVIEEEEEDKEVEEVPDFQVEEEAVEEEVEGLYAAEAAAAEAQEDLYAAAAAAEAEAEEAAAAYAAAAALPRDVEMEEGTSDGEGTYSSQLMGVSWDKSKGKWKAHWKRHHLGYHATEEAAAQAYNSYVEDGVDPVTRREHTSSQFKGVSWNKKDGRWVAQCKGNRLGFHDTEEAAAQAYNKYVKDGVIPVKPPRKKSCKSSSQFRGVSWKKTRGKWAAKCKGVSLGYHDTEEAAARAYDNYVDDGVIPACPRHGTSQFKVGRCRLKSVMYAARAPLP